MKKFSSAFTMIELIFVIVVLGILAGIAVPRLAATRDDATIAKIRGDIAAIRSGISLRRSENLMRGNVVWPALEDADGALFDNVLQQPIFARNGATGWAVTAADATYTACFMPNRCVTFDYAQTAARAAALGRNIGTFDCDHAEADCRMLAE
ncbi:MAG: prepilin-type N-terminal cleavage/methylation domain-containing protein [Campylobacter sp.]|nr:prepilin-type N-terminal cleavage/methylation domain-containing protein [Campylobacter sp.]MBQ7675697.1 prepilin-type N-terminal cleavage/methylation domain-containing protein [Campylobacter sp.]MBQ9875855.1 prepilin-type N-terminal cleavage/methylation domain-containing protein [Campylobacter sp.]